MLHEYLNTLKPWTDWLAAILAGVAAVSLSQAALLVTILAGLGSISLVALRWHDRFKYGRGDDE